MMLELDQKQNSWFSEPADIETASDDYARRFAGEVGAWMLELQANITLGFLRQLNVASVLDVGGGHGQLAAPLCREGYSVTVVGSADACGRRISRMIDAGLCRFQAADLLKLPYPARSFDAVVCFRLATHCERWPALIAELCRVARTAVIMDYPTSQSVNRLAPRLFAAKKKLEGDTRTWELFTHAEVREVFAARGFRERGRKKQFFLPMVAHRMLNCRPLSAGLEALARAAGLTRLAGSPVIGCYEPVPLPTGRHTR